MFFFSYSLFHSNLNMGITQPPQKDSPPAISLLLQRWEEPRYCKMPMPLNLGSIGHEGRFKCGDHERRKQSDKRLSTVQV